jgi:predicted small secreted protein
VRLLGLVTAFVAVSAVLTACATPTTGQAVPGGDDAESTSHASTSARATTKPQASPLADLDPCTLLNASARAKLGITTEGEPRKIVDSRGCQWRVRGPQTTYLFMVGLLEKAGIRDFPSNISVEQLPKIGDHQAVRTKGAGGTRDCAISLGVTDSSRVDAQAVAGADADKACELAMELAKLVEPELP